ncbi:MAG: cupin domain-containing protein [Bacteroidetes bacterium]|jgi:mannose-6-phosphate isomerase-like protein (cupin superfamily)|nr:cupin domain-containing protein [Bacteroidota bacterium]
MKKVNLYETLRDLKEYWSQEVLGEANGSMFKVARGFGEVNWHKHDDQDEVFIVIKGKITIRFKKTNDVLLEKGDLFVVPKGVEHSPVAENDVELFVVGRNITSNKEGGKPDWSYES